MYCMNLLLVISASCALGSDSDCLQDHDMDRDREVSDLSERQLQEFTQLGKFQLGQIRSQLDYEAFMKNYDLNLEFQLRKVGIITARSRAANNSKCFGELGCLEISERWYDLYRPVNLLPLDRDVINTQFMLRTREDRQERIFGVSDKKAVQDSGFDAKKPTKIIIHGFIDTGFETWLKDMSNALLDLEDLNVISVDWGGGSLPLYSQAAANTRLVGLEVARLVNMLIAEHELKAEDVHIIGHSLGSHIAGYAGERIPGLGRISGLDPAEPLFQGMPHFVRLDPTDALFVDVIHTDAKSIIYGGYGLEQPIGHVDFYPNGGKVQPGCSLLELPSLSTITVEDITLPSADTVGRHLVACAHNRAIHLYIDSIRNMRTCPMVGHKCSTYELFKTGICYHCGFEGEDCVVMGYGARRNRNWPLLPSIEQTPRKLFLDTGSVTPFCQFHYLLEVVLASPREAEKWVQGFIKVNLYGEEGELTDYDLTPESKTMKHGTKLIFLVSSPSFLGSLHQAHVRWDGSFYLYCSTCNDVLYIQSIDLTFQHSDHETSVAVSETTSSLCGEEMSGLGYSDVRSGQWRLFYKRCNGRR